MPPVEKFYFCIFFVFLCTLTQATAQKKENIDNYAPNYHSNGELYFQHAIALKTHREALFDKHELHDPTVRIYYQDLLGKESLENNPWLAKQQDLEREIRSYKAVLNKERNIKKIYVGLILLLSVGTLSLYLLFRKKYKIEKERFEEKIRKLQTGEGINSLDHLADTAGTIRAFASNLHPKASNLHAIREDENDRKGTRRTLGSVLLNGHLMTEENWQRFLHLYEKEYPEFLKLILTDFPQVKGSGLRCVLLLKLGLCNKEIAHLLGVSPDTIKKTRQRLRYKMDEEKYKRLLKTIVVTR